MQRVVAPTEAAGGLIPVCTLHLLATDCESFRPSRVLKTAIWSVPVSRNWVGEVLMHGLSLVPMNRVPREASSQPLPVRLAYPEKIRG